MAFGRENTIPFKAVGGAGAAVTATSPAPGADHRWRLRYAAVSLSAAATAAVTVTINDGGTLNWTLDIPIGGSSLILPMLDLQGAPNQALTIAVAAPGGTIVARVNAYATFE